LQDFKGFERFKARLGVGDSLRTMALDPIFPYRENTLSIVDMRYSPRMSDRKEFLPELEANMLAQINTEEATLILFPSRQLMTAILPSLRKHFGLAVLAQGDKGIKELVAEHRSRVDEGSPSI